jgi:hypothetical protein
MGNEHPDFLKTTFVQQKMKPLSGRHFSFAMLRINAVLSTTKLGLFLLLG